MSCKGTTCQYGLLDSYAVSEEIYRRFYEGYREVALPHKFKISWTRKVGQSYLNLIRSKQKRWLMIILFLFHTKRREIIGGRWGKKVSQGKALITKEAR